MEMAHHDHPPGARGEQSFLSRDVSYMPTVPKYHKTKKGGEDLMVVTSRGGVGCCWVNSIPKTG